MFFGSDTERDDDTDAHDNNSTHLSADTHTKTLEDLLLESEVTFGAHNSRRNDDESCYSFRNSSGVFLNSMFLTDPCGHPDDKKNDNDVEEAENKSVVSSSSSSSSSVGRTITIQGDDDEDEHVDMSVEHSNVKRVQHDAVHGFASLSAVPPSEVHETMNTLFMSHNIKDDDVHQGHDFQQHATPTINYPVATGTVSPKSLAAMDPPLPLAAPSYGSVSHNNESGNVNMKHTLLRDAQQYCGRSGEEQEIKKEIMNEIEAAFGNRWLLLQQSMHSTIQSGVKGYLQTMVEDEHILDARIHSIVEQCVEASCAKSFHKIQSAVTFNRKLRGRSDEKDVEVSSARHRYHHHHYHHTAQCDKDKQNTSCYGVSSSSASGHPYDDSARSSSQSGDKSRRRRFSFDQNNMLRRKVKRNKRHQWCTCSDDDSESESLDAMFHHLRRNEIVHRKRQLTTAPLQNEGTDCQQRFQQPTASSQRKKTTTSTLKTPATPTGNTSPRSTLTPTVAARNTNHKNATSRILSLVNPAAIDHLNKRMKRVEDIVLSSRFQHNWNNCSPSVLPPTLIKPETWAAPPIVSSSATQTIFDTKNTPAVVEPDYTFVPKADTSKNENVPAGNNTFYLRDEGENVAVSTTHKRIDEESAEHNIESNPTFWRSPLSLMHGSMIAAESQPIYTQRISDDLSGCIGYSSPYTDKKQTNNKDIVEDNVTEEDDEHDIAIVCLKNELKNLLSQQRDIRSLKEDAIRNDQNRRNHKQRMPASQSSPDSSPSPSSHDSDISQNNASLKISKTSKVLSKKNTHHLNSSSSDTEHQQRTMNDVSRKSSTRNKDSKPVKKVPMKKKSQGRRTDIETNSELLATSSATKELIRSNDSRNGNEASPGARYPSGSIFHKNMIANCQTVSTPTRPLLSLCDIAECTPALPVVEMNSGDIHAPKVQSFFNRTINPFDSPPSSPPVASDIRLVDDHQNTGPPPTKPIDYAAWAAQKELLTNRAERADLQQCEPEIGTPFSPSLPCGLQTTNCLVTPNNIDVLSKEKSITTADQSVLQAATKSTEPVTPLHSYTWEDVEKRLLVYRKMYKYNVRKNPATTSDSNTGCIASNISASKYDGNENSDRTNPEKKEHYPTPPRQDSTDRLNGTNGLCTSNARKHHLDNTIQIDIEHNGPDTKCEENLSPQIMIEIGEHGHEYSHQKVSKHRNEKKVDTNRNDRSEYHGQQPQSTSIAVHPQHTIRHECEDIAAPMRRSRCTSSSCRNQTRHQLDQPAPHTASSETNSYMSSSHNNLENYINRLHEQAIKDDFLASISTNALEQKDRRTKNSKRTNSISNAEQQCRQRVVDERERSRLTSRTRTPATLPRQISNWPSPNGATENAKKTQDRRIKVSSALRQGTHFRGEESNTLSGKRIAFLL